MIPALTIDHPMSGDTPELSPPTTVPSHPGPAHHVWRSSDTFRAVLFGTLAVTYAILLFPLTVAVVLLWLLVKVVERPADAAATVK
jgi:hypothetical protein